jgi:hypothetical protein
MSEILKLEERLLKSICYNCVHCRSIDIEGFLDCDILSKTRVKIYCRDFEKRMEPKR